jgi:CHAD domain-containing protein
MNSGSSPAIQQNEATPQPEWRRQVERWRALLAQCAVKPSRKRVHVLRSLTARLRVTLQYRLRDEAPDAASVHAFKRWKSHAKKLRRALQPVRDADVFLARLERLSNAVEAQAAGTSRFGPYCRHEIVELQAGLKKQRQKSIERLTEVLHGRSEQLNRLSTEMEAALTPRIPAETVSAAPAALRVFAKLAAEFPALDSARLHEYRKRLKKALYLGEISAASDPLAGQLTTSFKKICLAAGEWHDWQVLAQEASRVLAGESRSRRERQDGLVPELESLAEAALKRALGLSRRSTPRLLKAAGAILPAARRKPVAPVPAGPDRDEYPSVNPL